MSKTVEKDLKTPASAPAQHQAPNQPEKPTQKTVPNKSKAPEGEKIVKQFELQVNLNKFFSKGLIYILIGLLFLPFLMSVFSGGQKAQVSVSQLVRDIRDKKVQKLEVAGAELQIHYKDGIVDPKIKTFARKEDGQEALTILKNAGIDIADV